MQGPHPSRRCLLLGIAVTLVLSGRTETLNAALSAAQSDAEALVAAMQDGGKVIYLRHAATNSDEIDTGRLGDRAGQRNLSAAGIEQARALGPAFERLGIPLGDILASPVFRARDTAELAFGADRITVTMDLVADDYAGSELRAMLDGSARLLRTPPPPGTNRLLVGHRTPLQIVTGSRFPDSVLPEGAMAVFLPGAVPRLLGTISAERLMESAAALGPQVMPRGQVPAGESGSRTMGGALLSHCRGRIWLRRGY